MDNVSAFLFENLDIRGALVQLGPAWRQMYSGRGYAEVTRALLGELTAVTTLIGSNLKIPGRLTFHMQGHGAVRMLIVDCDEQLRLRGMAKAPADLVSAPLPELFGDGRLVLTLDTNAHRQTGQPYQSIVPLDGNSVAAVFEHYLMQSEQAPSRLWLMADAGHACGLFLQKLPDADKRDPDGWNRVQQLAATVEPAELSLPAETLLTRLFPEEDIRLFEPRTVAYHCPRDEQKVLDMLRALGRDEVEATLAEQGEIVIHDDICHQEYRFGPEVVDELFGPSTRTLH